MKKLLFPLAVVLVLLAGCNTDKGQRMLRTLDKQPETGMVIYNQGKTSYYYAPGVDDLMQLLASDPAILKDAIVADRRVGKAAAALLIKGGVKSVYTPLVCTPARDMLEDAGIALVARDEIPYMVNADSTGLCPLEKLLVCATTAEECQVVLFGGSLTGCEMLDMLNEQGLSLLVYNNDSLSIHANRGVRDLLDLLSAEPERLRGAIVADKIIGKAAAALMATGGVQEVHTNIICTPARELLEQEGIKVFAREEVEKILNKDKTHMCPIDSQLEGIETVEECVRVLKNMPPVL